jgi:hypothetical protein
MLKEKKLYYKASVCACERMLPRLNLACNVGTRIGLVDDINPKLQIKFVDEANPSKGFK